MAEPRTANRWIFLLAAAVVILVGLGVGQAIFWIKWRHDFMMQNPILFFGGGYVTQTIDVSEDIRSPGLLSLFGETAVPVIFDFGDPELIKRAGRLFPEAQIIPVARPQEVGPENSAQSAGAPNPPTESSSKSACS